jgi:hypothetical protein
MHMFIAAAIAGIMTLVAYFRMPSGEPGAHDLCSYLSVGLPLLGFVALKERTSPRTLVDASEPQPVDEEDAAELLRKIETESSDVPAAQAPPSALSTQEFVSSIIRAPQQAFREISRRVRPEMLVVTLAILLLQPLVNGDPNLSFTRNLLFLSVFFLLYALGRACLLIVAARWFSCRLSLRTAFQGVLIDEVIYAVLLVSLLVMPSLQGMSGQIPYIRFGVGELIAPLGETHPILFNYLAQLHVFTFWGFGLWWIGLATLTGALMRRCFVVALLSFMAMYVYVCPLRHLIQSLVVW